MFKFLDCYRVLSSGLDQLVKSLDSLPITQSDFGMDQNGFIVELFKKNLAYPYEYFTQSAFGTLNNFHQPLNLTKEHFWSTLKQSCPSDEGISRSQNIIIKYDINR